MGMSIILEWVKSVWFGPILTTTGAVLAVILTQHLTQTRERHARVIQEKRDTYLGALEAERDHRNALARLEVNTALIEKAHARAAELQRVAESVTSVEEVHIDEWMKEFNAIQTKLIELQQEQKQLAFQELDGLRHAFYWTARAEMFCSPAGVSLIRHFIDPVPPKDKRTARLDLMAFVEKDLKTHRKIKAKVAPWIVPDTSNEAE